MNGWIYILNTDGVIDLYPAEADNHTIIRSVNTLPLDYMEVTTKDDTFTLTKEKITYSGSTYELYCRDGDREYEPYYTVLFSHERIDDLALEVLKRELEFDFEDIKRQYEFLKQAMETSHIRSEDS